MNLNRVNHVCVWPMALFCDYLTRGIELREGLSAPRSILSIGSGSEKSFRDILCRCGPDVSGSGQPISHPQPGTSGHRTKDDLLKHQRTDGNPISHVFCWFVP